MTKTKDLKEVTRVRGEPRAAAAAAHRKPHPFNTNSIAGSRLPAVAEKRRIVGPLCAAVRVYNLVTHFRL